MDLRTPRLRIRTPVADDVRPLIALYSDSQVTRYVGGPKPPESLEKAVREDIASPARDFRFWTVERDGIVVGDCALFPKTVEGAEVVELNYYLLPSEWGQGLGTEIARALVEYGFGRGLREIVALIHQENVGSIRVAEKAGLTFQREVTTHSGNPRRLYALTRVSPAGL